MNVRNLLADLKKEKMIFFNENPKKDWVHLQSEHKVGVNQWRHSPPPPRLIVPVAGCIKGV